MFNSIINFFKSNKKKHLYLMKDTGQDIENYG